MSQRHQLYSIDLWWFFKLQSLPDYATSLVASIGVLCTDRLKQAAARLMASADAFQIAATSLVSSLLTSRPLPFRCRGRCPGLTTTHVSLCLSSSHLLNDRAHVPVDSYQAALQHLLKAFEHHCPHTTSLTTQS